MKNEKTEVKGLVKINEDEERWYPTSIDDYRASIKIPDDCQIKDDDDDYTSAYCWLSNFAYNMQYIQYIEKQLEEIKLSNVLLRMLYKNYIITGMGIVELLLTVCLKPSSNRLNDIIKEAKKNHVLTVEEDIYSTLDQMRKLRNNVHLSSDKDTAHDHDYNCITFDEFQTMRHALYSILTAPEICNNVELFAFIKENYDNKVGDYVPTKK